MMKMEASHIHKQHISVTLMLLERALIELERTMGIVPRAASLTEYYEPVPDMARSDVLMLTAEARRAIETIASELDLPKHEESITRSLLGNLHVRVVNVVELRPRYLRGGGEVPGALAEYMGAKADRLETLLRRLISLLEQHVQEKKQRLRR